MHSRRTHGTKHHGLTIISIWRASKRMAANIGIESGIDIQDPWRKEGRSLWQHHEHPDNFTDSSFLEALVVHAVTTSRSYRQVILLGCPNRSLRNCRISLFNNALEGATLQVVFASKVVAQQMGTVACVIAVSLHLREVRPGSQ